MKKFLALLMAVMFAFGCVTVASADGKGYAGVVTSVYPNAVTVSNSHGASLTFIVPSNLSVPELGTSVSIDYSGDISTQMTAEKITVQGTPVRRVIKGSVRSVNGGTVVIETSTGVLESIIVNGTTVVSGADTSVKAGQNVEAVVAEVATFMTTAKLAESVTVEKSSAKKEEPKQEEKSLENKTLSGTVTELTGSKISIKTSKGKKWTFKYTNHSYVYGKYDLKKGCKVTITYDGYASDHPVAKKIKTTKAAQEQPEGQTTRKTQGMCNYYGGMSIGLVNGFEADVAYAKHTGSAPHGPGTFVYITYYTEGGSNYATKIQWDYTPGD
ncbi:MAG: hypothetical protein Q4C53_05795 [Clostridia bacterium]|nr:hypothetical protein [Clostridia bacterium]